jgi:hypothetical protein
LITALGASPPSRKSRLAWSEWLASWAGQVACGFIAGALLGVAAWGEGRVPLLALMLPLLVAFSRSRPQAAGLSFGFAVATLRFIPAYASTWFDGSIVFGSLVAAPAVLLTGGVWTMGWSGSGKLWRKMASISVAWLMALLPPVALGVAGHPLVAAGFALPGAGWAGVLVAWLAPAAVLWVASRWSAGAAAKRAAMACVAAALAVAGVALHRPLEVMRTAGLQRGVLAQQTAWGGLLGNQTEEALRRIQRMGSEDTRGAMTVVWAESIIGRYEPPLYPALDVEVLRPARRSGRTVVVGMDIPTQGNRLLNGAVAFYPDGNAATVVARQPAPISLWRPWRDTDTFVADWGAHNMLALGQGDRAAVIFCYEEYLPVLYLLNELLDDPSVYLVLANTWAASDAGAAAVQGWHSFGMARLFGRAYLKAENRPTPVASAAAIAKSADH